MTTIAPASPASRPAAPRARPDPRLRITRRTGAQRPFLPRIEAAARELALFAELGEVEQRAGLAVRLRRLGALLPDSPFHASRLRRRGLGPRDLRRLEDLAAFPFMDRRDLARGEASLPVLPEAGLDALVYVETSGSGGRPIRVLRDTYECLHMWAVLRFLVARLGIRLPPRPRVVLLCALVEGLEYSTRAPLLDGGALHRLSTARPHALARLRRASPAIVFSDPAGLHWLAAQEAAPRPRLVLSSAQHLPARLERRLTGAGVPVVDYYATTETGPVAWGCLTRRGRYHVLLPDVWVESVAGELVVTRLRPSPLPLLRYRTGDAGEVARDECTCGYRGWSVTGFQGRRSCAFVTPVGTRVDAWNLAPLFKRHPLDAFRLTQTSVDAFGLDLVGCPGRAEQEPLVAAVRHALARLGWPAARLDVRGVARLVTCGGKPEPFRCRVRDGGASF